MRVEWPIVERTAVTIARDEIWGDGLAGNTTGLILCGDAGSGKSVAARGVLEGQSGTGLWVAATAAGRGIPMGVFAHCLRDAGVVGPVAGLWAVRKCLALASPEHTPLLVVDDGHHLDEHSAWVVHQLVAHGEARLVVTIATGQQPVSGAISSLWEDGYLRRVELEPFSLAEASAVLESAFGGPVSTECASALWRLTGGNPARLRSVALDSMAGGALAQRAHSWMLAGEPVVGQDLLRRVGAVLKDLDEESRRVVSLVALCGWVRASVVERLASPAAVVAAESASVLVADAARGQVWVRLADPLLREAVMQELGILQVRALRGELVDALGAESSALRGVAALRAELLAASDGWTDPAVLVAGARDAVQMARYGLAVSLARRAIADAGSPSDPSAVSGGIALAWALSCLGHGEEADETLARIVVDAFSEVDKAGIEAARIANRFWVLGDAAAGIAALAAARASATCSAAIAGLEGLDAAISMYQGDLSRASRLAERVFGADRVPAWGRAWAAFAALGAAAVTGRSRGVEGMLRFGLAAAEKLESLLYFQIGYADVQGLLLRGEFEAARGRAADYVAAIESDRHGPRPAALGHLIVGVVHLAEGSASRAVGDLSSAVRMLNEDGTRDWRALAETSLYQARAMLGTGGVEIVWEPHTNANSADTNALFQPALVLKSAWQFANGGREQDAQEILREAAAVARGQGQFAVESAALHLAVRFGATVYTDRLRELAHRVDGRLASLASEQSAGWADGDPRALAAISARLQQIGALLCAADAAAQASVLHERQGQGQLRNFYAARAHLLAVRCGAVTTPALRLAAPQHLTVRERQIVEHVARIASNRGIAETLALSVRTVEGHVLRACEKLGVADRQELVGLYRGAR